MDNAWSLAFEQRFVTLHKQQQLRRPSAQYLEGVKLSQRRALRIMRNHFHRILGRSQASIPEGDDDIPDEVLLKRLKCYEDATDPTIVPDDLQEAAAPVDIDDSPATKAIPEEPSCTT